MACGFSVRRGVKGELELSIILLSLRDRIRSWLVGEAIVKLLFSSTFLETSFQPGSMPQPLVRTWCWKWLWCGGPCHKGQADCYTAASVMNHKVMITADGVPKLGLEYTVGIVFQPQAVDDHLTKCSYQFDGAAFNKLNGGCGCGAPAGCNRTDNAFTNKCPETGKDMTPECPSVTRCGCDENLQDYPGTCFWRGAAFYSSATPKVPPNLTAGTGDGLRKMMQQRIKNQDGRKTPNGIPLLEYWNEATLDGKVLKAMLNVNPAAAVAAFMYQKGNSIAKGAAKKMSEDLNIEYGSKLPVVAMDLTSKLADAGPFSVEETDLEAIYL